MLELAKDKYILSMLWNKAIKRECFIEIWFDEKITIHEDFDILTRVSPNINSIVYIIKGLYFYCFRADSLVNSGTPKIFEVSFNLAIHRCELFTKLFGKVSLYAPLKFCWILLQMLYVDKSHSRAKIYENFIKTNINDILFDKSIDVQSKKHALMVYLGIAKWYVTMKGR